MMSEIEGNLSIGKHIQSGKPLSIIRLRSETNCLEWYLNNTYPKTFPNFYEVNGGLYPLNEKIIEYYSKTIKEGIELCNYSAYWSMHKTQYKLYGNKVKKMKLIHNRSLEPFYFDSPWSQYLKNKKVLVIHPFSETIKQQYLKKDLLWKNKDVLPNFTLNTLKSEQSSAGGKKKFSSWIESLKYMINELKQDDFDIALIGCGCYDIPISNEIKKMGKQSIIIGGGLQILFGIKGKRWDNHPLISKFYNDNWVRPSDIEKPNNYKSVEGGCYW